MTTAGTAVNGLGETGLHQTQDNFQRIPFSPATDGRVESHSGLTRHYPTLHGNLVTPLEYSKDVGLLMSHPASNFLSHFLLRGFAERGFPIMGVNTRYSTNEPALIMERAALDLGCAVRWMREELGFKKVVLLGFSGGGSLSAFYQSQALHPTITATPAGDPVDMTGLIPADGLAFVGAHPGRARVLRHWIDGAVVDENDPYATDEALNLFAPGRTAPLDPEFVQTYRDAQLARIRRIDAWALEQLDELDRRGAADRAFVVHRTVADPRYVDLAIDPSDRALGSMYGDPATANLAAGGLARFTTVRSWLSTWSFDRTNADAVRNLTTVDTPTMVACLRADQAAFVSDSTDMYTASADPQAEYIGLDNLSHYLVDQPEGVPTIVDQVSAWMEKRGLREAQSRTESEVPA